MLDWILIICDFWTTRPYRPIRTFTAPERFHFND